MKRLTIFGLGLAAFLAACGGDVKATRITPDLLENPEQVRRVVNRLDPAERPVFGRYMLSRAAAASPIGRPILILTPEGRDPQTVGQAIELTKSVMALESERDTKTADASGRMDAEVGTLDHHSPEGMARYNAAVKDYNDALKEFSAKLAELSPPPAPQGAH